MSKYDLLIVSAKAEDVNQYSHMRDSVRATLFGAEELILPAFAGNKHFAALRLLVERTTLC